MSRNPITSDRANGRGLSRALATHAEERDRLIENLTKELQENISICSAWLWGSFMRGEQDDLSDLDVWLLVNGESVDEVLPFIERSCRKVGTVVYCGANRHNDPDRGRYFGALIAGTQGLHHLDIYWQPVSAGALPPGSMLFHRALESDPRPAGDVLAVSSAEESQSDYLLTRFGFAWLMLSVAAKYLARDPSSDMSLMKFPHNAIEEIASSLGQSSLLVESDWTIPTDPLEKVDSLRNLAAKLAVLEEMSRRTVNQVSPEANFCLMRYFDLTEAILRDDFSLQTSHKN